jgi:hypothetical protein
LLYLSVARAYIAFRDVPRPEIQAMSKAVLFLHTLEDVRKAARSLGYPVELVAHRGTGREASMQVIVDDQLEAAFRLVRSCSSTQELAVIRQ